MYWGLNNSDRKQLKDMRKKERHNIAASIALPGKPLSLDVFKKCIDDAENGKTVSLEEAKMIWAEKKEQIRRLINH